MSQMIALIDYGSGNLHSAEKALLRSATDRGLDIQVEVTADPEVVREADRLVLPGVGAFGACMTALQARPGLVKALEQAVLEAKRPFLGICVGMQLLATKGLEHGETAGLGWIDGTVGPLQADGLKVPHMGWNHVEGAGHPLLPPDGDAYFVHSYAFAVSDPSVVAATATYGQPFPAM
ncbi:MAG: imidazole glycerol phosphate synthase subunit HisH, partial [Pseudomonadota bacterium]